MLIKASRITNLTDARYFAAKEVDFLGFNLEEGSESYLDPMYMKAIREWVEGPKIVGEFFRSSTVYIREAAAFFGLDAVQVTSDYADQLADLEGLTVILELTVAPGDDTEKVLHLFRKAAPFVSCFLVHSNREPLPAGTPLLSENELPEHLRLVKNVCTEYPVLLQSDLPAEQLTALIAILKPAGLSLSGGEEEKTGVKSFDEIEALFETLGRS